MEDFEARSGKLKDLQENADRYKIGNRRVLIFSTISWYAGYYRVSWTRWAWSPFKITGSTQPGASGHDYCLQ